MKKDNNEIFNNVLDTDSDDFTNSYLALALGSKEFIYNDIDKIYKNNRILYYELYKSSSLSKLKCYKSLNALQEEYVQKIIGIIEYSCINNDTSVIYSLIKKGYNLVFRYYNSHELLSIHEVLNLYYKTSPNPPMLEIQNITSILVYLHTNGPEKDWDTNDPLNDVMTQSYLDFINQTIYQDIKYSISKSVTSEQVTKIRSTFLLNRKDIKLNRVFGEIRQNEASKLGFNKDLDASDYVAVNYRRKQLAKQGISKYISAYERLLCANQFHPFFLDVAEFSEVEIDYIVKNCIDNQSTSNIPDSEMNLYITSCLFFSILIKEYRKVRDLYLNKSKEDLFLSLKTQREEIGRREHSLEKKENLLTEEICRLKQVNGELRKVAKEHDIQLNRINNELKTAQSNDKELQSLREMLFKLDHTEEPHIHTLELEDMLNDLTQEKLVFISGQISLVAKLKELLPKARFLDIDKLSTDLSFLDNYSSVFVDVSHISHAYYYRLTTSMNKNSTKLCFITKKTNVNLIINEMYEFINER
ncbi:hypothetical protein KPL37_18185 [Clostridium frigoris]|uniref:Uncharacterized protein n=1 Tax=Clostridium frigoris TaxID=205327 RepID=A0ABS6BYE9_9CLOT|nr:hypothetical protein [Clostridium frigoris]MBU3161629.1 hypothetical protein [Clostridium frigoris]